MNDSLFPLLLSRSFRGVKENHVIIFIDSYQTQTLCKQIEQTGTTWQQLCLCEHKHASQQQLFSNAAVMFLAVRYPVW